MQDGEGVRMGFGQSSQFQVVPGYLRKCPVTPGSVTAAGERQIEMAFVKQVPEL
jgi:hypothetical protein